MGDNWYKCEAAKVLNGTADMKPDQRGIYRTLLDILYDKGGVCAFDPKTLAARNCTTTRHFNRVMDYLIEEEKIVIHDGYYMNEKVFLSINSVFMTELARKYCKLIFPELFKNKGLAAPRTKEVRTEEDIDTKVSIGKSKKPRRKPLKIIDENWRPKPPTAKLSENLSLLTPDEQEGALYKFINHHIGKQTKSSDFNMNWRTWITNCVKWKKQENERDNNTKQKYIPAAQQKENARRDGIAAARQAFRDHGIE